MKNLLTLLLLSVICQLTFSQKKIIDVSPGSAQLFWECEPMKTPKKLNIKDPGQGILGVKEGYATKGYTFKELRDVKSETFTIKLDKVTPLPEGFNSKSIEIKKINDATGKVERPDRQGMYGINIKGTALNSPLFMNTLAESMSKYGYDVQNLNSLFEDEEERSNEIGIVAQLEYFSKDTRGDGFQVSLIVEWSIYSYAEKKIVLVAKTAGYSDEVEEEFNLELASALDDALVGLLINKEFQEIVKK